MYGSKDPHNGGQVHYRCHRSQVAGRNPCGYWIAWEKDLLPYVQNDFLRHIGEKIEALAATPTTAPAADDGQAELAKLDKKFATARQRFLEASPAVAKGLAPMLEKMEREREELAARLESGAAADDGRRVLEEWTAHLRRLAEARPVMVGEGGEAEQAGAWGDALYPAAVRDMLEKDRPGGVVFPAAGACRVVSSAELREALKKIGAKVSVWFKPRAKGRGYEFDKVRLQANVGELLGNGYASKARS
jgi:hypothetical protein